MPQVSDLRHLSFWAEWLRWSQDWSRKGSWTAALLAAHGDRAGDASRTIRVRSKTGRRAGAGAGAGERLGCRRRPFSGGPHLAPVEPEGIVTGELDHRGAARVTVHQTMRFLGARIGQDGRRLSAQEGGGPWAPRP
jgi:hypothetical protein